MRGFFEELWSSKVLRMVPKGATMALVNPETSPAPSGEKIEDWRWKRHMSVPELASKAGITRQYLKRICKGERGASLAVQQSIAAALDVPVSEIQQDAP